MAPFTEKEKTLALYLHLFFSNFHLKSEMLLYVYFKRFVNAHSNRPWPVPVSLQCTSLCVNTGGSAKAVDLIKRAKQLFTPVC